MIKRGFIAAIAMIVSATAAAADGSRQPTGRWIVEFDDAACVAHREYGTERAPLKLLLKQPPLGSVMQVAVLTDKGARDPLQLDGSIAFDDADPTKLSVLRYRSGAGKGEFAVHSMNVPDTVFAAAVAAKSLHFKTRGLERSFALTSTADLLKVMAHCVEDLR